MITATFFALLAMSAAAALLDWRRGWFLVLLCGTLQDPARKMTPGSPVVMSLSVVVVYAVMMFAGQEELKRRARELATRFGDLYIAFLMFLVTLGIAAVNGIVTFGFGLWKVPLLSLIIYTLPLPAVLVGYTWLREEKQLEKMFVFYAAMTSVLMIGTVLEYLNVDSRALGTVALGGANLRWLPGLEIRMLSGFYRAPDIMGWHAATLTSIGIIMAMRRGSLSRAWPWIGVTAWGFLNCIISGRRKAVYMVGVFAVAFLWRYFRRLRVVEAVTFGILGIAMVLVVQNLMKDESTSVYARGTGASSAELVERLEGGLGQTVVQFGFLGAGLGTATQGTQHLTSGMAFGWQEGGLGKLALELGVPGLFAVALLGFVLLRLMLKISGHTDLPETSQVMRAGLFGMIGGDLATFLASAQAYSDPLLAVFTAFTLGALIGTAMLDERARERVAAPAVSASPAATAATA